MQNRIDGEADPAAPAHHEPPREPVDGFLERFTTEAGPGPSGLYLVGSPGLGDFSPRQSNLDLVAVTDRPLSAGALDRLAPAHRGLAVHGRDAAICYVTWEGLAGRPEAAAAATFVGRRRAEADRLANPMTWAILAGSPVALSGPDRPAVHSDPDAVRDWFSARMPGLVDRAGGLLWRRGLARMVLQVTRCAHGARTGQVLSLRDAGQAALPEATHTGHRVITDALGYREGANTSMYWGPFERKSNALGLAQQLLIRTRVD